MAVLIRDNPNEMISNYHLNFTIMCIIGTYTCADPKENSSGGGGGMGGRRRGVSDIYLCLRRVPR